MNATPITTPEYESAVARLLDDDETRELEFSISTDPEAHPIIKGTGGVLFPRGQPGRRLHDFRVRQKRESQSSPKESNALYDLAKRFKHEKEKV